jgi:hypothetical protein
MTRDRLAFAIALTLVMDASVWARSRVIYRGRVGAGNPACLVAAGPTGAAYLLLASPPEFRSIDSQYRHHLTVNDPPLGDDDIFLSGDIRYAVARSGAGTALLAGRSLLHQFTAFYQDRWIVSEGAGLGSWKVSDTLDTAGAVHAMASRNGVVWAVGYDTHEELGSQWLVRRRSAGRTWTTVDRQPGYATAVQVAADGVVYVAGIAGQPHQWIVRRSTDGQSWATVDRFRPDPNHASFPRAIAADGDGHVHVVGYAQVDFVPPEDESSDATHWIVRSSTDGGFHFHTTDDFTPKKRGWAIADDVAILPSGDVVVVGAAGVPLRRTIRILGHGQTRWKSLPKPAMTVPFEHHFAIARGPRGTITFAGEVWTKKDRLECLVEQIDLGH